MKSATLSHSLFRGPIRLAPIRLALTLIAVGAAMLVADTSDAHIRITPSGRMGNSDREKFIQNNRQNPVVADSPGPCSNFRTRMVNPIQLNPGQTFSFSVQETINHPGRFYVQFSQANDSGFWNAANQLALVQDTQNNGTTTVSFTVPNTNCNTCTIRVLQEMDEQPGEYYVHCVDVNIGTVSANPTPTPSGNQGAFGANPTNSNMQKPGFGGCGTISKDGGGSSGTGGTGAALLISLFMFPLMASAIARSRETRPVRITPRR